MSRFASPVSSTSSFFFDVDVRFSGEAATLQKLELETLFPYFAKLARTSFHFVPFLCSMVFGCLFSRTHAVGRYAKSWILNRYLLMLSLIVYLYAEEMIGDVAQKGLVKSFMTIEKAVDNNREVRFQFTKIGDGNPFSPEGMRLHAIPAHVSPKPQHRLLVVVPFRDAIMHLSQGSGRWKNLATFAPSITEHLVKGGKRPGIDFSILVVEQEPGLIFNKGALLNAGYHIARKWGYDYMALHDVDQIPEITKNNYAFNDKLVHMCTASDQFDYRPAYDTMLGGVLTVSLDMYESLNGFSNNFWGWGQEDDDFYTRVIRSGHGFRRISPRLGRYTTLKHPRIQSADAIHYSPVYIRGWYYRRDIALGRVDPSTDGVSSLNFTPFDYRTDLNAGPLHIVTVKLNTPFQPLDTNGRQVNDPENHILPGFPAPRNFEAKLDDPLRPD